MSFTLSYSPFFTDNKLISSNQSGFRPSDSCVNQLLAITYKISKSFDDGLEVREISYIYQRLLKKCGLKDNFLNHLEMVSLEILQNFWVIFNTVANTE